MKTMKHDFLIWTSFPSSIKTINDDYTSPFPKGMVWQTLIRELPVNPDAQIRISINAKQKDVFYVGQSLVSISGFDGVEHRWLYALSLPLGSHDWDTYSMEQTIPNDIKAINVSLGGAAGTPEEPGITWFDDLEIYQDGELIYENKFTNWKPIISISALIVIGVGLIRYSLARD